jgi:predicted dehydrogenase
MTPDAALRAGIIGCGRAGLRRLGGAFASGTVEIVFACDPDPEALAAFSRRLPSRVPTYSHAQAALADHAPALLFISAPPSSHERLAVAAIEAGSRHVLVEKPLACTPAGAARIVRAARLAGAHLKVGSNLRQFAESRLLAQTVRTGDLGAVRSVSFNIGHDGRSLASWATDITVAGGGTLLDNGIHAIDLALALGLLPPRFEVEGTIEWVKPGLDAHAAWTLGGGGLTCRFSSSWKRRDNAYFDARIEGDRGVAELLVRPGDSLLRVSGPGGATETRIAQSGDSWAADTLEFVQAARTGGAAGATGPDGLAAVCVADLAYRAAKLGRALPGALPVAEIHAETSE